MTNALIVATYAMAAAAVAAVLQRVRRGRPPVAALVGLVEFLLAAQLHAIAAAPA